MSARLWACVAALAAAAGNNLNVNSPDLRGNPTGTASSAARDHAERAQRVMQQKAPLFSGYKLNIRRGQIR